MKEMKGLIIETPHIDRILSGEKTWEMRSMHNRYRGLIALIRKRSGTIVGVAEIVDSLGPLSEKQMLDNQSKHLITPDRLNTLEVKERKYAWVLKNARRLKNPVPYSHKNGAQSRVILDEETTSAVLNAIG
jgi:hypothetical protein